MDYKLILVKWHDASSDSGEWLEETEIDADLLIVRSVGFLLDEDNNSLLLGQSYFNMDGISKISNTLRIPKSSIIEKFELGVVNE